MKRVLIVVAVILAGVLGYVAGHVAATSATSDEQRQALEEAFRRSMTGVALEGVYTVDGVERPPSTERYTVERVEKLAGDLWLFHARLQFGDVDVSLPVPVKLLWAGDTPVATLTDATLPGLGTFSARIVFYRGRYAGLWSNPETGGFQYGTFAPAVD